MALNLHGADTKGFNLTLGAVLKGFGPAKVIYNIQFFFLSLSRRNICTLFEKASI